MKKLLLLISVLFISTFAYSTNHSGNLNTQTWYSADNPHIITGNVTVNDGETLTIEAGCEIKFDGNYRLVVYGALHADGTTTDHIIFTSNDASPDKGDWRNIHFSGSDVGTYMDYCDISYGGSSKNNGSVLLQSPDGNVSLSNCLIENSDGHGIREDWNSSSLSSCTIRDNDKSGLYLNGTGTIINDCSVTNNGNYGIYINNGGDPSISNSTISNNSRTGIYVRKDYGIPIISSCTINNNDGYAIRTYATNCGSIIGSMSISGNTTNKIWVGKAYMTSDTWYDHGVPYYITDNIYVESGNTFTIMPGTELQFKGKYKLEVWGALIANGTDSEHILFTSGKSNPKKGDWKYIYLNGAEAGTLLNYCDVFYSGSSLASVVVESSGSNVTISNCNISNGSNDGIIFRWNTLSSISNCVIHQHDDYGIYCQDGDDVFISDCQITNCNDFAIRTTADNVKRISGTMDIHDNKYDAIEVEDGTITSCSWQNVNVPYVITDNWITVSNGETLTLTEGVEILFDGDYKFLIEGALVANGTAEHHVVFSSFDNTPSKGDWDYVYFNDADAGTSLHYCDFLYGGDNDANVYIADGGSNISFTNCTSKYSDDAGFYITASSPSFINCTIMDNDTYGIELNNNANPTFGSDTTEWNAIYSNGPYEFMTHNAATVAEYVFWGNNNCIGAIDDLIYDDDESWRAALDFTPYISNSQISFDVETVWSGSDDEDWNNDDNWDNCKPCAEISARIPKPSSWWDDQPTISSIEDVFNLKIEKGAEVTIETGNSLDVYGDFYLYADASSSASFIDNGTVNIQGEVYADFHLDQDRWHYVSPPVDGAMSEVFLDIYLADWFEDTQSWAYINPIDIPLNQGEGFAAWSSSSTTGNKTIVFTGGDLNTGTINLNVTATDIDGSISIDPDEGWNFVGNPYPSAIDWDLAGWTKTNLINSVYVWDGSQYLVWNGSVGNLTDGIIPTMQGFMVKASDFNPSLQLSNSTRIHGSAPYKSVAVNNLLSIKVEGNEYSDEAFIHFNKQASIGFDNQYDAYKRFGDENAPQLYSMLEGIKYSINELPSGKLKSIPMGFQCGEAGSFTLTFKGVKDIITNEEITLEDTKENAFINLSTQSSYTFDASTGDDAMRFILHFGALGEEEIPSDNVVEVYSCKDKIFIENPSNIQGIEMDIMNVTGQIIHHASLSSNTTSTLQIDIPAAYYFVRLKMKDGTSYTKKIFVQ